MKIESIYQKILILICLTSIIGGIIYKTYKLDLIGLFLSVILITLSFVIILLLDKKINHKLKKIVITKPQEKEKKSIADYLLVILYFLLFLSSLFVLTYFKTDQSIISPWEAIPSYFFILYFLTTVVVVINIIKNKKLSLLLLSVHYFLTFIVTSLAYKLYYGFDPFIHEATLNYISENGSISPKPFYYLGYYSLIIIIHKITFLPIFLLNKFIVPLLASIFIPFFLSKLLFSWFNDSKKIYLSILFLTIFPFSHFIISTPQNFANLFLFLPLIIGLNLKNNSDLIILYLLSLTTLLTHPISGIPIIIFTIIIHTRRSSFISKKNIIYFFSFSSMSLALPVSFLIFNKINLFSLHNYQQLFYDFKDFFTSSFPKNENFILNFVYLINNYFYIIFFTISFYGLFLYLKHKKDCKIFIFYLTAFLSTYLAFLLTKLIPFDFLIAYERSNYTTRIFQISLIFLLPFILISIYQIITKIFLQNRFIKYSILTFLIILSTISLYLSYPRNDNYFNSHGYATSINDIMAVEWIEKNSSKDYIVLANQQVSAAALHVFGFKKYHQNDIFYYPIPTGGKLYEQYLKMLGANPSREIINNAMDIAGVNETFFVLNKYWWASEKIKNEIKVFSDSTFEIANGEITIFKFNR